MRLFPFVHSFGYTLTIYTNSSIVEQMFTMKANIYTTYKAILYQLAQFYSKATTIIRRQQNKAISYIHILCWNNSDHNVSIYICVCLWGCLQVQESRRLLCTRRACNFVLLLLEFFIVNWIGQAWTLLCINCKSSMASVLYIETNTSVRKKGWK